MLSPRVEGSRSSGVGFLRAPFRGHLFQQGTGGAAHFWILRLSNARSVGTASSPPDIKSVAAAFRVGKLASPNSAGGLLELLGRWRVCFRVRRQSDQ